MAQTPCKKVAAGGIIPDPTTTTRTGGDVYELGTIPLVVCPTDPNQPGANSLDTDGLYDVPKDTSTFTAGDPVYWDANGSPVTGTALSGAATSTASGNNLMGVCTLDAATGDSYVRTKLTAAKRTTAIAGSVTADDITGSDSSLAIAGLAAAQGGAIAIAGGTSSGGGNAGGAITVTGGTGGAAGAGGAITISGGAPASGNAAGGATTIRGGAGSGTGAGGAMAVTGGASGAGATGNGGAVTITGGAAASTNGNGGSITLTPGALAGTGAPGAIKLTGFVQGYVAQTIDMADAAVTLTRIPGTPTGTLLTGNWLLVDANSSGTENLLLPPEADMTNALLLIKNTGGETINLQNDAGGAVATIATSETCFAHCDGTNWTVMQHVFTT